MRIEEAAEAIDQAVRMVCQCLDEIEDRYPEDMFPIDGEGQDCASARFARNIVGQVREKVMKLKRPSVYPEATPKDLANRFGMTSIGMYKRLHHRNCPATLRHKGS